MNTDKILQAAIKAGIREAVYQIFDNTIFGNIDIKQLNKRITRRQAWEMMKT